MATVTVYAVYKPGKTLTADFYPIVGDTATLTDQTMNELSNGKGVYTCSATASWSDLSTYRMHIKEGGVPRAVFEVYFSGGATARAVPFGLAYVYAYMAKVLYETLDTITGADGVTLATAQGNYAPAKAGDQMALVNDAITASKFDESTAFPLKSADAGSTAVFRTGADSDTGETLSDQIDGLNNFDPTSDTVANVTTVGTCTTNTDMRGTDNAFLAASAPTNFADLAITATTGKVTVGTNDDKTGYAVSSSGLDLVTTWTVDVTGSLSGSVGSVTGGINTSAGTITTLDGLDTAQDSQHGTTQSAISGLNNLSAAQVNSEVDSALSDYDGPTKAEMDSAFTEIKGATWAATDTLEAIRDRGDSAWTTATGFSTHNAADVRTEVDSNSTQLAAIVEDTGTTIPAQITALNNLSASEVNAEVDTALADYDAPTKTEMDSAFTEIKGATWSGTTDSLEAIRDRGDAAWTTGAGGSAPTVEEIRAEMDDNSTKLAAIVADTNELQTNQGNWVTATGFSTHSAEDVRTEIDSNSTQLAAIVTDTNELQTDWTNGGRLDLIIDAVLADTADLQANQGDWATADVSGLATSSALATVDSNVDSILTDTGTTIPAQISGLNNISTSDVLTQASSALTSYDPPTRAELTTDTNSILSAVATVDGNVDSILVDTSTTIPAQITGLNDISASDVINYNMGDGRTVLQALSFLRNKWVISGGTLTVYQTDDSTESWSAEMTQTAGNPTSSMDPN